MITQIQVQQLQYC